MAKMLKLRKKEVPLRRRLEVPLGQLAFYPENPSDLFSVRRFG